MVWGGSLNENGSNYLRKVRKADKIVAFLEEFKQELKEKEKLLVSKTINIIVDHINKLSEKGNKKP
ncbi:MAG: hypothetical protein BAJALOKI2v1_730004 [Promethearchaeota archaeon]|nr:MAG: hypothetical protein BAJALOKI2v1_730004 [Candidatus Lokiarchaeota archaeon]